MHGIIEKYNEFIDSTYFKNLKVGGRFTIYYLAATFAVGCLGSIIGSPILILPLAMLGFHPLVWVVMGIALAVVYKIIAEPLFHLAKNFIDKKFGLKKENSKGEGVGEQKSQELSREEGKLKGSVSADSIFSPGKDSKNILNRSTSLDSGRSSLKDGSSQGTPTEARIRRASGVSSDSGVSTGDNEFNEDLSTLVHQTNRGHYGYWLQQHDIARIARICYGYSENSVNDVFFSIPGDVNSLNEGLKEYKKAAEQRNAKKIFTSVINLGGNHWVTLIVIYNQNDRQYKAYYCDSFGNQLPNEINGAIKDNISLANEITESCVKPLSNEVIDLIRKREDDPDNMHIQAKKNDVEKTLDYARKNKSKLVNKQIDIHYIVGVLQETLGINGQSNINSSKAKQQKDGHNCGIFALENAHRITQMLNEGKSFDEIEKELSENILSKEELIQKRQEFTRSLMDDGEWKEDIAEGGILHDTIQRLIIENNKEEEPSLTKKASSFMYNVATSVYNGIANTIGLNN